MVYFWALIVAPPLGPMPLLPVLVAPALENGCLGTEQQRGKNPIRFSTFSPAKELMESLLA